MRHRKSINHLSRTASHRKSMLANMASSLIMHKRIETTTAKAKALRTFVEPLITKSKEDSTHSRRTVFSYLQDKDAVTELFREVSPKIGDRPGGYTRILKTGTRLGDNADMCIIELVDFNENLLTAREETADKSSKRRRRGSKKKSDEQEQVQAPAAVKAAQKKTVAPEVAETPAEKAAPEAEASADTAAEEPVEEVKDEAVEPGKPAEEETDAEEKKEE
ncbi:MAG: 50S ribosomal protein L17 [Bacteroidales bacterium]|nr:50S ribosomal protein L17 [Bacteroidales bacterium]